MALIRFVADVHIGNHKQFGGEVKSGINSRCRRILKALKFASEGCDRLVVLGDLFDTSSPSPQIIAATQVAFGRTNAPPESRYSNLLLGNHDMVSTAPGDHALGPLRNVALITEEPEVLWVRGGQRTTAIAMVPFRPEPMVDWFAEAIGNAVLGEDSHAAEHRILCFHGGVRDHNTPKYLWSSPDAIDVDLLFDVMNRAGIRLALCGNWHNHRTWQQDGMKIIQVGALVPTGFDNAGWDYGGHVDYQTNTGTFTISAIPSARFLALTLEQAKQQQNRIVAHPGGVYLKVKLLPGETQDAVAAQIESMFGPVAQEEDPESPLLGLSFAATEEETEQQEQEAAAAARTADSLEDSLREYVKAMPLPDGVDRQSVETKVLNYMGRE